MENPIVCKFGGTSVASAAQIRKVEAIVRADPRRRFIVPSAPGKRHANDKKITDLLYTCHQLAAQGLSFQEPFQLIREHYGEIVRGLEVSTPLDTELELAGVSDPDPVPLGREEDLGRALEQNAELRAAREAATKAEEAVRAGRYEYIPNVGAFARHTYQSGVPFLVHNFGTFGLQMTWNVFDWGKRKDVVNERRAQLEQAQENVRRITDRITVDIDKAWRKLERTKMMVDVAREALATRRESERISSDELRVGVISPAKNAEAVAAVRSAEADELQARLGYYLALAELENMAGTTAP